MHQSVEHEAINTQGKFINYPLMNRLLTHSGHSIHSFTHSLFLLTRPLALSLTHALLTLHTLHFLHPLVPYTLAHYLIHALLPPEPYTMSASLVPPSLLSPYPCQQCLPSEQHASGSASRRRSQGGGGGRPRALS